MGRPGGPGPLDPIFDVPTQYGSIGTAGSPGVAPLTVVINQDPLQPDPAFDSPIIFDVTFSEATTSFATGDVTITGTAGGTKVGTVVDTGDHIHFYVYVTGMLGAGSVIANILANVCYADSSGIPNAHSTSDDNIVQWNGIHPDDVGGLFAWWDTTDQASMTYSAACPALVTAQADKSGHAYTVTPTGTSPQLGVPTGVNGGRRCNLTTNAGTMRNAAVPNTFCSPKAITLFLVCSDIGNTGRFAVSGSAINDQFIFSFWRVNSTTLRLSVGKGTNAGGGISLRQYDYTLSQTSTSRELRMFSILVDNSGADPVLRVDGSPITGTLSTGSMAMTDFLQTTPAGPLTIDWGGAPSASTSWSDTISPTAILYNSYLSASDLTGVEAYLTHNFFTVNDDEYVIPYTGANWTYVVPSGKTSCHVELWGAEGGDNNSTVFGGGGNGGFVEGDLATTPGETLTVVVGGAGKGADQNGFPSGGGFNGGGSGDGASPGFPTNSGGGGGATDIRRGGTGLADRIVVAGGGGGDPFGFGGGAGGLGGGTTGGDGITSVGSPPSNCVGAGGTQIAGGAGSAGGGSNGALGVGGNALSNVGGTIGGGGGGGGYYGGGGGSHTFTGGAATGGGGGGSSYVAGLSGVTNTQGVQTCHGMAIITPN